MPPPSKSNPLPIPPELARYSRQVLYEKFGLDGQRKLSKARAVLIGCGALGTVLAQTLVRAGLGFLRICDRDFIELNNLQRQVLFDESDIKDHLPKAEAAARRLRRINSDVTVEAAVVDVTPENIETLAQGADIILDGTDNFETRFLINDLAVETKRPWVYGAVVGATGMCMPIIPGKTPCLRCVFDQIPPPHMNPTCDTAGVLGPAVQMVAAFQAMEVMKILIGRTDDVIRRLINIDAWSGRITHLNVQAAADQGDCVCCKQRRFEYLHGSRAGRTTTLCGRDAVQVHPGAKVAVDFAAIAASLNAVAAGRVRHNPYMLTCELDDLTLTLFPDGRAIIKGTDSVEVARSAYAKYFGC
ncbi:MAG: ThiF family adenylyltransferase [Planctomycetes bacterium]|nr:ThiF family adenylyltransferase [Planctomycetota bacterium]